MSALTDTFTAIANAIRSKLGVQTTYTPTQMSDAIASIPTQKPEQTKSVTATTSAQTVTPDTGKVLSSVTVNPQTHSEVYTPTGYNAYTDMGIRHNYRYVDTSGYPSISDEITPDNTAQTLYNGGVYKITNFNGYAVRSASVFEFEPDEVMAQIGNAIFFRFNTTSYPWIVKNMNWCNPSDSSPVALQPGTVYHVNTAGYAIESQPTSVTPSSTPTSVSSGDIVKIGGSGVIVDSVPPTPTSITPSNSSPVALTANTPVNPTASGYAISSYTSKTPSSTPSSVSSGSIYKMGGSGYVVDDYNSITPSDSSPVSLSSGRMYRTSGSGYAIASQPTSKTPSDSSPPSISSGSIIKASAAGYLYSTNNAIVPSGTLAITTNGTVAVRNFEYANVAVNNGFTNLLASNYRNIGSTNEDPISIYSGSTPPKFIIYSQGRVNGDSVCCAVYDVFNDVGYYRKYTGGSWKTGTIGASNDYFTYYKSGANFHVNAYKYASGIQVKSVIYVF